MEIGSKITSIDGIAGKVVNFNKDDNRVTILFDNGVSTSVKVSTVKSDGVSSKSKQSVYVGEVYKTNSFGDVTVVEYVDALNVVVRFVDGIEMKTTSSRLQSGSVGHPLSGLSKAVVYENNMGFKFKLIKYHNPRSADIMWECGNISYNVIPANIKNGGIYYPNTKSVVNVGYFGFGKYKPNKGGQGSNYNERVYASWQRMIRRCYDAREQKKPSHKAYVNVKVCDEWHNFQNFAEWAEDKEDKFISGWELDKDMFGTGLIYSPDTCTLLPEEINIFLSNNYSNKISDLPEGVNEIKPKTKNSKSGYIARCHVDGKRVYLGYFETPEEAGNVYREAKELEAKRLAEKYKDVLSYAQHDKLFNFKLEDIHRK